MTFSCDVSDLISPSGQHLAKSDSKVVEPRLLGRATKSQKRVKSAKREKCQMHEHLSAIFTKADFKLRAQVCKTSKLHLESSDSSYVQIQHYHNMCQAREVKSASDENTCLP